MTGPYARTATGYGGERSEEYASPAEAPVHFQRVRVTTGGTPVSNWGLSSLNESVAHENCEVQCDK